MSKRGRDRERGGEGQRGMELWEWQERQRNEAEELAVPHSHVVDKNWEGYLGIQESQPQTRPLSSPGFQC